MRLRSTILAGVAAAAVAAVAVPAAAYATVEVPAPPTAASNCTQVKHGDLAGIVKTGAPVVTLQIDGVEVKTPAQADKAVWSGTLATPVALSQVQLLQYRTRKLDTDASSAYADPAFHVYLKLADGKTATLVFEPYWQSATGLRKPSTNAWEWWQPSNLTSKFWTPDNGVNGMVKSPGGGDKPGELMPWGAIVAANPTAAVTGYGWGLGSYNTGADALVNDVTVKAGGTCTKNSWSTSYPTPAPTATAKPTATPTATVAPIVLPTSAAPHSSSPAAAASLPVTGSSTGLIVGSAVVLLAVGGGAIFVVSRRRRTTFEA